MNAIAAALIAAADDDAAGGAILLVVLGLALFLLVVAGYWKTFEKAGEPGWKAIIPIYNIYVLLRIVGRPGWWLVLMLIPFVNIVIAVIVANDLSTSFGKGLGFTVGLLLLTPVFAAILGFGDARFLGPGGPSAGPGPGAAVPPPASSASMPPPPPPPPAG